MDNYSPELERAQLLEEFTQVDAKFNSLTGERNDARLERAKLLLRMQETFPISGHRGPYAIRDGWKEWCNANVPLTMGTIWGELCFARDPERLVKTRERDLRKDRFKAAYNLLKRKWPDWTNEQRQKIIDRVVELTNAT